MPEHGQRKVYYAGRQELEAAIQQKFLLSEDESRTDRFRQRERSAQKHGIPAHQEAQTGQSIVTGSSFTKKQDGPPPAPDGR